MLSHEQICRAYLVFADEVGLREGDRYLVVLPFFHSFGLHAGILCCLMMGATIVPLSVFEPAATMKRIVDERITAFPGAPAMYQAILNHPDADAFDASSLRLAILGAAAIPVELVEAMRGRLGIETVVTGYGITEGSGIVTMCRYDDPPEVIAHTCGRPLPGLELRLVDDDGVDAATEAPGEVLVRGYTLMRGYLDDPEQTAEAIDTDGWLHTGDIGVLRADGNLVITDRKKDMFVVGGFNVYPAEIENVMLSHPAVGQVAVVGIPDARLGEVGMAYVIRATGHRARSRRDRRVVPARDGQLQGAAPGGDRRRAPVERQWQGPQVRVARARRRGRSLNCVEAIVQYVPPAEMLVETDGPVTIVTMNNPEMRNAFVDPLHDAMRDVWEHIGNDPTCKVAVLTGAGKAFSAGGNVPGFIRDYDDFEHRRRSLRNARRLMERMAEFHKPLIAAVNGPAVGLGCSVAVSCDIVLIAESAFIADTHVNVGLVAGDGGAVAWPLMMSLLKAKEYLFTGDRIPAELAVVARPGEPGRARRPADGRGTRAGPPARGAAGAGAPGDQARGEPAPAGRDPTGRSLRTLGRGGVVRHREREEHGRRVPGHAREAARAGLIGVLASGEERSVSRPS